jgi:replication factor C subunit 3/5
MTSCGIPLVEQYRPKNFDDIVLDPLNRQILNNVIETSYFPNLLFYGPPGTGKTTTIINLINAYQLKLNNKNKDLIIHLNASDDRGIDIIRNQISQFVNSQSLFASGLKFVILDEVDYMTKTAQHALKYLIQGYNVNVRFCLICNYISRIDESLQNEFMRLRFNQLPEEDIHVFLKHIAYVEKLNINDKIIKSIQQLYKSDIRSMINYMQTNQDVFTSNYKIINNETLENIYIKIINNKLEKINMDSVSESKSIQKQNKCLSEFIEYIRNISIEYNIDNKNIIKYLINYIIRFKQEKINKQLLDVIENIMHNQNCNNNHYIGYVYTQLSKKLNLTLT